ncbi:MAG: type IX secretion system membrane protein PorP/SprF [Cyclobacteriaceae bacterium]|nr:type IX secretion system membrane protein PorP/SprF [Cyclobacteriaceae bacterium]
MKKLPFVLVLLMVAVSVRAQQVATYSQYMFNTLAINPAYAGSHQSLSATALARFQNVGMPGAPTTQTFSAHSPIANKRMSLGFLVVHDKISIFSQSGINAIYAYRIPVSVGSEGFLSFGIQGGLSLYSAEYSSLDVYSNLNPNLSPDPAFSGDIRASRPNIGAGIYYSSKHAYLGLSAPHLINNVFDRGPDFETVYQNKPFILNGGYVFEINRMLKLKPNFLMQFIDGQPIEFDINANLLIDEVVWVGASYKSSQQVVAMTQIQITDQLQFGYSYTITAGPIRVVELGSHEAMLNYRFKFHKKGVITPRYF